MSDGNAIENGAASSDTTGLGRPNHRQVPARGSRQRMSDLPGACRRSLHARPAAGDGGVAVLGGLPVVGGVVVVGGPAPGLADTEAFSRGLAITARTNVTVAVTVVTVRLRAAPLNQA